MGLDEYPEPKGAYYTPALVAKFESIGRAEQAIDALRQAGFTPRDIDVARTAHGVTVIVSEPTPGMLTEARRILTAYAPTTLHPYGSEHDAIT